MKYIEEYIPKLHIHQHSLLTRKVFFRHNFLALVFFSVSTRSSRLQVIFVFKSYSSSSHLDLDHLSIWINTNGITGSRSSLDLDHHHCWIWIITRSGSSSLDWIWIITRSGSSLLDLDHHSIWISRSHHNWIWIIARSGSPLVIIMGILSRHRKFYRASPFSCWM